jgi:hypothetical protein
MDIFFMCSSPKILSLPDASTYCRRDAKLAADQRKQCGTENTPFSTKVLPAWPGGQVENFSSGKKLTIFGLNFNFLAAVRAGKALDFAKAWK